MSIEKTKLNYLSKGKIEEEQVMVETLLSVPDLQKLLWVEAEPSIEAITPSQNEVGFSGQLHIFGAYLDAEKKIRPYESTAPFMGKAMNEQIDATTNVNLVAFARWADFAEKIFEKAGKATKVKRLTTEEYPTPTKRPAYSVLENRMFKLTSDFMFADWEDALDVYLKDLLG